MEETFNPDFVQEAIEETPYTELPARDFLQKWCEINDSISPVFIKRKAWEQKEEILEKTETESGESFHRLWLPKDLHLWEMVDVIETVDNETFNRKPELKEKGTEKIEELASTFKKAGVYINENLNILEEGKDIADDLSKKFFNYGLSLEARVKKEGEPVSGVVLDENDRRKLDKWLLGEEAYERRMERLGSNPKQEDIDSGRRKLFKGYFKALSREGSKGKGDKPWEQSKGPIQKIQEATKKGVAREIRAPRNELGSSIFRRGVEKLITEMTPTARVLWELDFGPQKEYMNLYNLLGVKEMKRELEEIRGEGNVDRISQKELEIAKRIHSAVISYPYKSGANNPSEMVKERFLNCVGSSLLGGALLDEVGIKYLHADLSDHSATVLITSDGKKYWQDFTPSPYNIFSYQEITRDTLEEGVDLSEVDVTNVPRDNFRIELTSSPYVVKYKVKLYPPEIGLQLHILNNTGNLLSDLGREQEAVEAYREAINIDPQYAYAYNGLGNVLIDLGENEEAEKAFRTTIRIDPQYAYAYNGLGNVLIDLGRSQEAVEAYRQATKIDPQYAYAYNGLGNVLIDLGRSQEAVEAYRQATKIDPQYANPYNGLGNVLSTLGRNEEALEAYKTFIPLWRGEQYWIDRANEKIKHLEQLINKEN
jgi:tetratricopeptide (TPR) repeat protein